MLNIIKKQFWVLILLILISFLVHINYFTDLDPIWWYDWWFLFNSYIKTSNLELWLWRMSWESWYVYNTIPFHLIRYIIFLLSLFFSYEFIERLIFLSIVTFIAPIWIYVLLKKFTKDYLSIFLWSLLFLFSNSYIIEQYGNMNFSVAYAMAPLIYYYFFTYIEDNKIITKNLLILLVLIILSWSYDLRLVYLIFISFVIYSFINFNSFSRVSIIVIFWLLLSSYWFLPFLFLSWNTDNFGIIWRDLFGWQYVSLIHWIFNYHPYFTLKWISIFTKNYPYIFHFITFWLIWFIIIFFSNKNKYYLWGICILLIWIFLLKINNPPFKQVYIFLYNNLPWFNLFREPIKFFFLINISISILFAISFSMVRNIHFKVITSIFIVILTIFNIQWIFFWNIKNLFFSKKINLDYYKIEDILNKDLNFWKVLYIPRRPSDWYYNVYSPAVSLNMADKYKELSCWKILNEILIDENFLYFLKERWIKYIVIDDGYNSSCSSKEQISSALLEKYWQKLKKIYTWEKIIIIELEDYYPIFMWKNIYFNFHNSISYYIKIISLENQQLNFLQSFNFWWELYIEEYNLFKCEKEIKYKYNVSECKTDKKNNRLIIFRDNPVFKETHKRTYWYANSWELNWNYIKNYVKENYWEELISDGYPKKLQNWKKDYKYYLENEDWSIDIVLSLYFKPQSYFYLWLLISWFTFIILLLYLWFYFYINRKNLKNK